MTPNDLDAIRARDADAEYLIREGEYAQCKMAMADRRALLAEVDRLGALADRHVGPARPEYGHVACRCCWCGEHHEEGR